MVKIVLGVILFFIFVIFSLNYWDKSDKIRKKIIKGSFLGLIIVGFLLIVFLLYD